MARDRWIFGAAIALGVAVGLFGAYTLSIEKSGRERESAYRPEPKTRSERMPPLVKATSIASTDTESGLHGDNPRELDPVVAFEQGRHPPDIFRAEERDREWSEWFEGELRGRLQTRLSEIAEGAEVEELECRTSSCRVTLAMSPIDVDSVMADHRLPALGNVLTFEEPQFPEGGPARIVLTFLFRPEQKGHESYGPSVLERTARADARTKEK